MLKQTDPEDNRPPPPLPVSIEHLPAVLLLRIDLALCESCRRTAADIAPSVLGVVVAYQTPFYVCGDCAP